MFLLYPTFPFGPAKYLLKSFPARVPNHLRLYLFLKVPLGFLCCSFFKVLFAAAVMSRESAYLYYHTSSLLSTLFCKIFPFPFSKEYAILYKHSRKAVKTLYAPVAQLDRALDSDSKGHRFDSCRAYQKNRLSKFDRRFYFL